MTSEQIKKTQHFDLSANQWLKEIAYQLALSNEKREPLLKPELRTYPNQKVKA